MPFTPGSQRPLVDRSKETPSKSLFAGREPAQIIGKKRATPDQDDDGSNASSHQTQWAKWREIHLKTATKSKFTHTSSLNQATLQLSPQIPPNMNISVVIPATTPPSNARTIIEVSDDEEDNAEPLLAPRRSKRLAFSPDLFVVNDVDGAELPTNFRFVKEYVFVGTKRLESDFRSGCTCRLDNGRNVGCEYVQHCECLEDSAYGQDGKRLGFPYGAAGSRKGCLQAKFLRSRHVIYECSSLCNCVAWCRNKVVQHGCQISLEIFRTRNRGWGLRSTQAVQAGQFIDTYRGEVITDEEASRRESASHNNKDSYLFSLDKFADQVEHQSELYVVDGETRGGPTRFINHSCDPNCAIFAVSTTRGDAKVYDLAFFALEDIDAGTEFTFDYLGEEQPEESSTQDASRVKHMEQEKGKLATRCLCGSVNCRGYLWL